MASSGTVHASAVLVGARAVLIRGPSGSGKSRLALDTHRSGAHRVATLRSTCCRRPGPSGNGKRAIAGSPGEGIGRLDRGARGRPETHRSRTERRGGLGGRSRGSRSQAFAGRNRTHHRNRRYQVTATCRSHRALRPCRRCSPASIHRRIVGFSSRFAASVRSRFLAARLAGWRLVNHNASKLAGHGGLRWPRRIRSRRAPLAHPDRCIGAKRYRNATTARYRRKCLLRLGFGWSR